MYAKIRSLLDVHKQYPMKLPIAIERAAHWLSGVPKRTAKIASAANTTPALMILMVT